MQQIKIADTTLCRKVGTYSFKEKLEIARQLDKLDVDIIELPEISDAKTDILLIRTIGAFLQSSTLSVAAGKTEESVVNAKAALENRENACIRIEVSTSTVGMEYTYKRRGPKMLEWIRQAVSMAKEGCANVEFCALDATRAEEDFLAEAIDAAVEAGATSICICDSTGGTLPDDFAQFVGHIALGCSVPVAVRCSNLNGLAEAQAILSVRKGVSIIKTAVDGDTVDLDTFATMIKNCGDNYGFRSNIKYTELHRIVKQIRWVSDRSGDSKSVVRVETDDLKIKLTVHDEKSSVMDAVSKLGYDLTEDDQDKVYESFLRLAAKKTVGAKELEAIVASTALQVPPTYKLENYVINTGSGITSSAQITLNKNGNTLQGISLGDGPIDAAFLAVEQILGRHFELDDFQIQSVTEGKEAMGSALVKIRVGDKLYSGSGISTDIIGASIRAYIGAVNKVVYEEI